MSGACECWLSDFCLPLEGLLYGPDSWDTNQNPGRLVSYVLQVWTNSKWLCKTWLTCLCELNSEVPNTRPETTCIMELLTWARQSVGLADCPGLPDSSTSAVTLGSSVGWSHCYTLSYLFLDVLTKGRLFKTGSGEAVLQWLLMLCCAGEIIQCI